MSKTKSTAKTAPTQAPGPKMQDILIQIRDIKDYLEAIAGLSWDVSTGVCKDMGEAEEQRKRLEILAEAQVEHVGYLEEAIKKAGELLSAAPAPKGGAA